MTANLSTVVTIIAHTPLWVWPLYVLLLFLGFQRTRDSSVALFRVLILPVIVILLALLNFVTAGLSALPSMCLGFIIGSAAGWQLESESGTRRLPDGKVWLRGEWWTFAQILLVLIFRYAINIVPFLNPVLNANPTWQFSALFTSAALSALFLGRTVKRLKVYFRGSA
jgi:teichoic acid transport system permease protein